MSAATTPFAAPPTGRVIAVASGKGGVGKTWLAITLAQALARAAIRHDSAGFDILPGRSGSGALAALDAAS